MSRFQTLGIRLWQGWEGQRLFNIGFHPITQLRIATTSPARRSGYGRPLLDCAGHIAGAAPSGNHCSPCEARRPARCAENARSSAARPLRLRPLRSRLLAPLMSLQHLRPRPPVPVAPVPHSRDQRPSIIARPISTRSAVRSPSRSCRCFHLCFQACWITSRTSGLRKSS